MSRKSRHLALASANEGNSGERKKHFLKKVRERRVCGIYVTHSAQRTMPDLRPHCHVCPIPCTVHFRGPTWILACILASDGESERP